MGKTRALITIVCANGTVYFNDTDYASTFTQALVASLGRTAGTLDPLVSSLVDNLVVLVARKMLVSSDTQEMEIK